MLVPKVEICQKYFLDKNFQKQPFWTCNSQNLVFHPYIKTSLTQAISLTEAMFMASSTVNFQLFYPYMKNTLGKDKSILRLVMTALCKLRYSRVRNKHIPIPINLSNFFLGLRFYQSGYISGYFLSLGYLNIKGGYIYSRGYYYCFRQMFRGYVYSTTYVNSGI